MVDGQRGQEHVASRRPTRVAEPRLRQTGPATIDRGRRRDLGGQAATDRSVPGGSERGVGDLRLAGPPPAGSGAVPRAIGTLAAGTKGPVSASAPGLAAPPYRRSLLSHRAEPAGGTAT